MTKSGRLGSVVRLAVIMQVTIGRGTKSPQDLEEIHTRDKNYQAKP